MAVTSARAAVEDLSSGEGTTGKVLLSSQHRAVADVDGAGARPSDAPVRLSEPIGPRNIESADQPSRIGPRSSFNSTFRRRCELITALTGLQTVLVADTASESRWPAWAATVRELGVASVLDAPMDVSHRTVGVLSLYSPRIDGFDTDDEAVAQILARHAAVAVANARHEQALSKAVDARELVGQAMGILMERYNIDDDRAFAVLRRYSQHQHQTPPDRPAAHRNPHPARPTPPHRSTETGLSAGGRGRGRFDSRH